MSDNIVLNGDILGLDLGKARTGVARIHTIARIAEPLSPLHTADPSFIEELSTLIQSYNARALVVGMPRNLDSDVTAQTKWTAEMCNRLQKSIDIPLFTVDEAGTTRQAEERAQTGQSIDSVAACIIVEDFIAQVTRGEVAHVSI